MALLDTNEILQLNDKITTFVLVKPGRVDDDDVDLFVVQPPPAVRDSAHHASIQSASHLCDGCRGALEYFSYVDSLPPAPVLLPEEQDEDQEGSAAAEKKEEEKDLPSACLLHSGAKTLQEGDDAGCHLCVLLMANLRVKRLAISSIDQSNIEMCWQKRSENSDARKPGAGLLHFALTHRGHPRSSSNYWNILKLRRWPASEFDRSLLGGEGVMERHSNTGSTQSRDTALQWLGRCRANEDGKHHQCNRPAPAGEKDWLPTRLLDVVSAVEKATVKLVTPAESPEAFVTDRQYVTLSHCWGAWGGAELPVLTTKNLEERRGEGLSVSLLPQTFKDAVEIANWFNVRWLWIDSLCILQDSAQDWQREAVMMYDVYKNALLNISADDSPDARWGCFRERSPLAVIPMRLQSLGRSESEEPETSLLIPDSHAVFDSVSRAPLAKRGWVFQERQLSRRVLHFTSSELLWECCADAPYAASETFPGGTPFERVFDGKSKFQSKTDLGNTDDPREKLYSAWNAICKEYSTKVFSHPRDKLVALSGLAQEFEAAFPDDTYAAGMWRSTLPGSLLWESAGDSSRLGIAEYVAPSWSWASMGGPISPSYRGISSPTHRSLVDILAVATDPVIPSKPTALLKSASIRLRCFLRPVEVRPDYEKKPWYMLAMGGGKRHQLFIRDDDDGEGEGDGESGGASSHCIDNFHSDAFGYSFDVEHSEDSGPESVAGYFLPVCVSERDESSGLTLSGLLVEPVGDGGDGSTYRRVGVLHVYGLRCLLIKYKLRVGKGQKQNQDQDQKRLWEELEQLLSPVHESEEKERKGGSGSLSPDDEDDDNNNNNNNDEDEAATARERDSKNQSQAEKDDESASATEKANRIDDNAAAALSGEESRELKDDNNITAAIQNEKASSDRPQPKPKLDFTSIDPLDRLYALDDELVRGGSSDLQDKLEKLVAREITLL